MRKQPPTLKQGAVHEIIEYRHHRRAEQPARHHDCRQMHHMLSPHTPPAADKDDEHAERKQQDASDQNMEKHGRTEPVQRRRQGMQPPQKKQRNRESGKEVGAKPDIGETAGVAGGVLVVQNRIARTNGENRPAAAAEIDRRPRPRIHNMRKQAARPH